MPEFLGVASDEPGKIYSLVTTDLNDLLNQQPVDFIIDFSSTEGIYTYGKLRLNEILKSFQPYRIILKRKLSF